MTTTDYDKAISERLESLGINYSCEFIPKSRSRHRDDLYQGLNYKVTFARGTMTLITDYSMGIGHCPADHVKGLTKRERAKGIELECETGFRHFKTCDSYDGWRPTREKIEPRIASIVHSLLLDAGALDCFDFKDWCGEYGYDTDSRKAFETYTACLENAIKLRGIIGESVVEKLKALLAEC